MDLITSLIIPLLTIFLSGVISSVVTYRLNSTRSERDLRLQKIEELVMALDRFADAYTSWGYAYAQVLKNPRRLPVLNDAKKAAENFRTHDILRARMIVAVYFEPLQPFYNRLHGAWKRHSTFLARADAKAGNAEELSDEVRARTKQILSLVDQLKTASFGEAKNLRHNRLTTKLRSFVLEQIG